MCVCGDFVLVGLCVIHAVGLCHTRSMVQQCMYGGGGLGFMCVWGLCGTHAMGLCVYRCMAGSAYVMGTLRYMCDTLNKKALL